MLDQTLSIIRAANLQGFAGNCGVAAVAIQQTFFPNMTVRAGFNRALLDEDHCIGHIAVCVNTPLGYFYVDSDGRLKTEDELLSRELSGQRTESWGQLDDQDPDYQELMAHHGLDASDPLLFEDTELVELSRNEALYAMECEEPETLLQQMLEQLCAAQSLEPVSSCVP